MLDFAGWRGAVEVVMEPDSGEGPVAFDGSRCDGEEGGDLVDGKAAEVAKLDYFGLARVGFGEAAERVVE